MDNPEVKNGTPVAPLSADQKNGVLMAVAQLEMLSQVFPNAPKRVSDAHKEFMDALKEWAA